MAMISTRIQPPPTVCVSQTELPFNPLHSCTLTDLFATNNYDHPHANFSSSPLTFPTKFLLTIPPFLSTLLILGCAPSLTHLTPFFPFQGTCEMVKGNSDDKSLPSSVNKGRSNLGENSRINFVENSILEELNRSGNIQSKGVLDSQLELLLLLQNQKQQQRQQNGKDKDSNLSRGGSAPPTVEGASSATEGLIRNPSFGFVDYHTSVSDGEVIDAEVRSHPAYLAYYYSNINNNPRLPPPLLSLEEWRIFQRFQEVGSSTGEYGNWRNKEFAQDGSGNSSLFQMQRGIPSHKAEDDLIEMRKTAARNLSRISSSESMEGSSVFAGAGKSGMGGRRKSFADILQGEPGKSSTPPSRLSRPASYNSLTDMINHSSSTSELEKKSTSSEALHSGQLSPSASRGSAFPKFFTAEAGPSLTKIKTSEPYRNLKSPPGFPSRSNRVSVDREENNVSSNSLSPSHKKTEMSDIPTSYSGSSSSKGQGSAGSPSESTLPLGFSNGHEMTLHQQFKSGGSKFSSLADYMNFMIENEVLLDTNFVHSNYERQMDYPKRASSMINLQSLANSSEYSMPGDSKLGRQDDTPKRVSSMVDMDSLANSLESIKLADQNIQGMTDAILKEQSLRRSGILGPSNLHSGYEQQNHYLDKSDDCGRSSATVPPNLSRARNVLSTSYSADDLHELGKIYKEAMLSQQKQQDQLPFFYKPGHLNSQYHDNTSSGSYMYQGSPRAYSARSFAKSGGRLQKEGASRFSNSFKSKEGLSFGSRKSEGKATVEGKFGSGSQQELKNNKYKTLELTEVLNDVVKFSKDQHGSRFIQQRLETANVEEKMKIFSQIAPHARELMTDVFGNYVIQKFFENGTESQRRELANQIIGHVLPLSLQMYGCRVIQKALEVIDVEQQTQMVKELDGSVLKCVHDQNGNHVIQKCIECIPPERIQFIVSSFFGQIVALSTHPYGCRVIQRVLEHCNDPHMEQTIMDEIMESICTLAEDQYGNYVIQHVLEHGKPHERSAIIAKLTGQIVKMSQHKFASNVVEKCLIFSAPEERKLIVKEMLGSTEENEVLQAMMKDPFGNYVVQKVLETCDDQDRELILSRIRVHLSTLKKYTYGKHIVSRVEKLIEAGERQTEISTKNTSKDAS